MRFSRWTAATFVPYARSAATKPSESCPTTCPSDPRAPPQLCAGCRSTQGRRPPSRHRGTGNGPLAAFADALAGGGIAVDILGYTGHATTAGPGSPAMAYAECRVEGASRWGVGRDTSVLNASVYAVLAAVNRTLTDETA
ncbi:alpha-isopropylmalate synthase regulatory domain-containing protein [Streptomyces flavidovirens]|uniref:alpha-isopropylmalate synthase regulatory domain-containing protein n=1 Tax=Streptomyces flavidovirens TaxID=67298 RepID=UPI00342745E9